MSRQTHAEQIIKAMRGRGWMTWGDIEALRISTCPWKRLAEGGAAYLRNGERIARKTGEDGLLRLRVVRG